MTDARMAISAAESVNAANASPRTMQQAQALLAKADAALRAGQHEIARQSAGAARINAVEARRTAVLVANAHNAILRAGGHAEAEALLAASRRAAEAGDDGRAQRMAQRARALVP